MLNFWDSHSIGQICECEYNWTCMPIKTSGCQKSQFLCGNHSFKWPSCKNIPFNMHSRVMMAFTLLTPWCFANSSCHGSIMAYKPALPPIPPLFHHLLRLEAAQHFQQYLDKLPLSHMFIWKDTVPWCSSSLCCSPEWLRPPLLWDNATIRPLGRLRAPLEWHPRGAPKGPLLAQSSVCNTQALLFSLQWALQTPSANPDLSSHRVAHEGKDSQI